MAKQTIIKATTALVESALKEWKSLGTDTPGQQFVALAYKYDLSESETRSIVDGSSPAGNYIPDKLVAGVVQAQAASLTFVSALGDHKGISVVGTFYSGPHVVPFMG